MRTSKVALRINDTLIVGLVKKALMRNMSRLDIIQYLSRRNNWTTDILNRIDFPAFIGYITALSNHRRTNVIKSITGKTQEGKNKNSYAQKMQKIMMKKHGKSRGVLMDAGNLKQINITEHAPAAHIIKIKGNICPASNTG